MRRWIPRSLSGQTLAVLVLTLLVSQLIAITIYWKDRHEAVVSTEAHDFAERVVGMADLLHQLPDEWREDIVRESDGRTFHVTLDPAPDAAGRDLDEDLSGALAAFLARELAEFPPDRVLVRFTDVPYIPRGATADSRPGKPAAPVTGRDQESQVFLHISLRLDDARWLNFVGGMPAGQGLWLMPASGYILSVALGVAAVAMWLVFRVTAPLTAFAHAADRLGRDIQTEPLPETGPTEVAQASQAFNAMQERLRRLLENRTQILAALSHDLKTPVTLLKLRVELMQESEDRTRMLHAIGDMEAMIASVLEFTKATLLNEPLCNVDLTALLGSICDDMADTGAAVELEPADTISYVCRRIGLKRALTNLLDNAVKYGGNARVRLVRRRFAVEIEIDDDGPGIPEDRLEDIFLPFYRLDASRSEDEGGAGLGLSIAQTIIEGHGGRVRVENRPEGGLRVRISLPA